MNIMDVDQVKKATALIVLIFAGESVFFLPFVISRIYRPTFLSVFELTNFELGTAFSLYGVVAMLSYFFGGPLADRFSSRILISIALICTSLGGVVLSFIPGLFVLTLLYGFWGMTTILLFWSALIKATREWGGSQDQGIAFGLLDGGRGLVAASIASISIYVFSVLLPIDPSNSTPEELRQALFWVIILFSSATFLAGVIIWIVLPDDDPGALRTSVVDFRTFKTVLKRRQVWYQAIIVVCAYVGYKCTDDFSLYVSDAFGYDDVQAATVGSISFWVRPFAAVITGYLADRFSASRMIIVHFIILVAGSIIIGSGLLGEGIYWLIICSIVFLSIGIYALRGIYFALLKESNTPLNLTGTTVGIISFIGFTPDIFSGPIMGYLIDNSPGAVGHHHVFLFLASFGLVGLTAGILFDQSKNRMS